MPDLDRLEGILMGLGFRELPRVLKGWHEARLMGLQQLMGAPEVPQGVSVSGSPASSSRQTPGAQTPDAQGGQVPAEILPMLLAFLQSQGGALGAGGGSVRSPVPSAGPPAMPQQSGLPAGVMRMPQRETEIPVLRQNPGRVPAWPRGLPMPAGPAF